MNECLLIGLLYTNFTCLDSSSEGRSSAVDWFTLAATPFRWTCSKASLIEGWHCTTH